MLPFLVHKIFTFYINVVLKFIFPAPGPKGPAKLHVQQAQRGGAGIPLSILEPGVKMRWMVSTTPRPIYSREREEVPVAQEAGWTSELV
jgi:hypothetical protein